VAPQVLLDAGTGPPHAAGVTPPLEAPGRWIADRRGEGRGVRVSAHEEAGFLILSTWKEGTCVGTVRLLPDEAAALVAGAAEVLGRLASRPPAEPPMVGPGRTGQH
jgi:hypothetical protein